MSSRVPHVALMPLSRAADEVFRARKSRGRRKRGPFLSRCTHAMRPPPQIDNESMRPVAPMAIELACDVSLEALHGAPQRDRARLHDQMVVISHQTPSENLQVMKECNASNSLDKTVRF